MNNSLTKIKARKVIKKFINLTVFLKVLFSFVYRYILILPSSFQWLVCVSSGRCVAVQASTDLLFCSQLHHPGRFYFCLKYYSPPSYTTQTPYTTTTYWSQFDYFHLLMSKLFFSLYVEPSYTTKTYAPSHYSTKALTDIILLLSFFRY